MKIELDGNFRIKTDENNFILYTIEFYGKDSKNEGDTYEKVQGYYGNLNSALKGYLKHNLRKHCDNIDSIHMLIAKLESIENKIDNVKVRS